MWAVNRHCAVCVFVLVIQSDIVIIGLQEGIGSKPFVERSAFSGGGNCDIKCTLTIVLAPLPRVRSKNGPHLHSSELRKESVTKLKNKMENLDCFRTDLFITTYSTYI